GACAPAARCSWRSSAAANCTRPPPRPRPSPVPEPAGNQLRWMPGSELVNEPAAPQLLRVIVAALYPSVRAGLRALLDGAGGISVVGEAAHLAVGSETSFAAADVLVVDLDNGGDVESLRAAAETLPLVLLGSGPADFAGF